MCRVTITVLDVERRAGGCSSDHPWAPARGGRRMDGAGFDIFASSVQRARAA